MKSNRLRQWIFGPVLFLGLEVIATANPVASAFLSVLREPLAPEGLHLSRSGSELLIHGPTFTFQVSKKTGSISGLRVACDSQPVISSLGGMEISIDEHTLASPLNPVSVSVISEGKNQVIIQVKGSLSSAVPSDRNLDFVARHAFFNDGVVVSTVTLIPPRDFVVTNAIVCRLPVKGRFNGYLHKRRDENGDAAERGKLPSPGQSYRTSKMTSCLSVYSPEAALALFTDRGATHLSNPSLASAEVEVDVTKGDKKMTQARLSQYVVHVGPEDPAFILKSGEEFTFRTGVSVAPNRPAHPRAHDLRMFIWIGDAKYPYPTDEEISQVARWGYTMFQLHRVGTPGEPRPPAGELERVIRKVHEFDMLFIWEENADLLYAAAPGVQEKKAQGKWDLWRGFNYDGRYVATMDPFCDLAATCLASPNGMADYRLANIKRMLDRFPVDGIYLDDNLAYPNCTLWKEHGHPEKIYDCLIELHEMNWRRRELLRRRVPHAVLISHNTKAFVLPILADFDAQYFAEGYCFNSLEDYWNNYRAWSLAMNAQAMICPGDDEGVRCGSSLACNYDLLTGGGQYSQMDWRLFPAKFHYAGGVTPAEQDYSRIYNLAEAYFGLSHAHTFYPPDSTNLFLTTNPLTFAAVYRNNASGELLIPIANMDSKNQRTSMVFSEPKALGIRPEKSYLLFDVHERKASVFQGAAVNQNLAEVAVPAQNLRLFIVRELLPGVPAHIWGGKRLSEKWDKHKQKLTFAISGPPGLVETGFISTADRGIEEVRIDGKKAEFSLDSAQGLAHGPVSFTSAPSKVEVFFSANSPGKIPEAETIPDAIAVIQKAAK